MSASTSALTFSTLQIGGILNDPLQRHGRLRQNVQLPGHLGLAADQLLQTTVPNVNVKLRPCDMQHQKRELADAITKDVMDQLGYGRGTVSGAFVSARVPVSLAAGVVAGVAVFAVQTRRVHPKVPGTDSATPL